MSLNYPPCPRCRGYVMDARDDGISFEFYKELKECLMCGRYYKLEGDKLTSHLIHKEVK